MFKKISPEINSFKNILDFCSKNSKRKAKDPKISTIYTKSAGDFFLMHRSGYKKIKGYSEIRCDGACIDSLILYYARTFTKQYVFKKNKNIYHQIHKIRWNYYNEKKSLSHSAKFKKLLRKQKNTKKILNPNTDNWGFNNYSFKECRINNERN